MDRNEQMIAALLRERGDLVRRGKEDLVAQVDEQLQRYGFDLERESTEWVPPPDPIELGNASSWVYPGVR